MAAKAAAAQEQAKLLAGHVARLAAEIADAEDRIARVQQQRAEDDPERGPEHEARAQRARDFAGVERHEHRRWSRLGEDAEQ